MRFINHYKCPRCRKDWTDEWDAMCDDDCPHCGFRHVSPYESHDAPAFINHYKCPRCDKKWAGEWSATCDDDCPHCGFRHVSPYRSEDVLSCDSNDAQGN